MTGYDFAAFDARDYERDRKGQFSSSNALTDKRLKDQVRRGEIDLAEGLRVQEKLHRQADGSLKDADDRYWIKASAAGKGHLAMTKHPEHGWTEIEPRLHETEADAIAAVAKHRTTTKEKQ